MIWVIKWFFITLGVIFFCLIIGGAYFVVVDPFELRTLVQAMWGGSPTQTNNSAVPIPDVAVVVSDSTIADSESESQVSAETPQEVVAAEEGEEIPVTMSEGLPLSSAQQAALEFVGIDPATLPTTITPEQENCFIEAIGAARVEEIKAGAAPTPLEIFAGRGCL
jgi:hypothetical protein